MVTRQIKVVEILQTKQEIEKIVAEFFSFFETADANIQLSYASVQQGTHHISFRSIEAFYEALYNVRSCSLDLRTQDGSASLEIYAADRGTTLTMRAGTRQQIDEAIDRLVKKCNLQVKREERLSSLDELQYRKVKECRGYQLSPERVAPLFEELAKLAESESAKSGKYTNLEVTISESEKIQYPTVDEFLGNLASDRQFRFGYTNDRFFCNLEANESSVEYACSSSQRGIIERVGRIVESNTKKIPVDKTIRIFIGHGHSSQWRDLKDHLQDIHNYNVTAYEIGPRAGLSVKEVLSKLLKEATIALLVLTGEDEKTDGTVHARENVIHEVGLFQGRVGFERAIILLEEGVQEFSNILGINQIRFSKGNIREAFGDVIGVIRREFSERES